MTDLPDNLLGKLEPTLFMPASPATPPPVSFDVGIGSVVRMPLRTMSLATMPDSTPEILPSRYGFKMTWADAMAHAAEMIPFQTFWCFPNQELMSLSALPAFNADATVVILKQRASPKPAVSKVRTGNRERPVLIDLQPKGGDSLFGGILGGHLRIILSGVAGTAASNCASPYFTTKGS